MSDAKDKKKRRIAQIELFLISMLLVGLVTHDITQDGWGKLSEYGVVIIAVIGLVIALRLIPQWIYAGMVKFGSWLKKRDEK